MSKFIMAIDQGTTSSRAIIFDAEMKINLSREYIVHISNKKILSHKDFIAEFLQIECNTIWLSVLIFLEHNFI